MKSVDTITIDGPMPPPGLDHPLVVAWGRCRYELEHLHVDAQTGTVRRRYVRRTARRATPA